MSGNFLNNQWREDFKLPLQKIFPSKIRTSLTCIWGGQLWLRHFVVAVPEEKTRDYGIHNRRNERCITLSKRGSESPKPFPLNFQNSSWLFLKAIPSAPGVWTGIEPRSEWQAALCWWRVYSKAFEMPALGVLSFPLTESVLSFMAKNLWKQGVKGRRDSFDKTCVGKGDDGKAVKQRQVGERGWMGQKSRKENWKLTNYWETTAWNETCRRGPGSGHWCGKNNTGKVCSGESCRLDSKHGQALGEGPKPMGQWLIQ